MERGPGVRIAKNIPGDSDIGSLWIPVGDTLILSNSLVFTDEIIESHNLLKVTQ